MIKIDINGKSSVTFHLSYLCLEVVTSVNEVCFSCFSYIIMICVNALEWNECNVFGEMIVSKEMF